MTHAVSNPLLAGERLAVRLFVVYRVAWVAGTVGPPAIEHGNISLCSTGYAQSLLQKAIGNPVIGIQEYHPLAAVNRQRGVTCGIHALIFLMDKNQPLIGDSAE